MEAYASRILVKEYLIVRKTDGQPLLTFPGIGNLSHGGMGRSWDDEKGCGGDDDEEKPMFSYGSADAQENIRRSSPADHIGAQENFGGCLGFLRRMFRIGESLPSGMNDGDRVRGRMAKKTFFCFFLPPEEIKRGLYKEEFPV